MAKLVIFVALALLSGINAFPSLSFLFPSEPIVGVPAPNYPVIKPEIIPVEEETPVVRPEVIVPEVSVDLPIQPIPVVPETRPQPIPVVPETKPQPIPVVPVIKPQPIPEETVVDPLQCTNYIADWIRQLLANIDSVSTNQLFASAEVPALCVNYAAEFIRELLAEIDSVPTAIQPLPVPEKESPIVVRPAPVKPEIKPQPIPEEDEESSIVIIPGDINENDKPSFEILPGNINGKPEISILPGAINGKPEISVLPGAVNGKPEISVLPGAINGKPEITILPGIVTGNDKPIIELLPEVIAPSNEIPPQCVNYVADVLRAILAQI